MDLDRAAQAAGVHKSTIFRAIKRGELSACKMQEDGKKPQYFLESVDLDAWLCARTGRLTAQVARDRAQSAPGVQLAQDAQRAPHDAHFEQKAQSSPQATLPEPDLRLALEVAAKTLDQNLELIEQKQAMEAELALERARAVEAFERAARAERLTLELQHTLSGYQRALSEQADSLAEERARAHAAELALSGQPAATSEEVPEVLVAPTSPPQAGWTTRLRRWLLG